MSKLNGWHRLLLVFSVFSAVICFYIASSEAREKRIEVSEIRSNVFKMIAEDSKRLPCIPDKEGVGCGQEVSDITNLAIKNLKEMSDHTSGLTAKLFFLYWLSSIACVLVIFQISKFVIAGFKK